MAGNYTFIIIKPDAVANRYAAPILTKLTDTGFRISGLKMTKLTEKQAREFYAEHAGKAFFESLVNYMTEGPVIMAVLQADNAVAWMRKLVGETDPQKAKHGTLRKLFGESKERNAIHASDSDKSAEREANFFFTAKERY